MISYSFPLVSIVTPTKNRLALLRETILSVIAQTYTNWEMLIIDDFSTDNTYEMLKEFSSEKRIVYHKRKGETGGAQVCRNLGIELAKGEYLILLDSDDLLTKTCVENRVKFITENSEFDFAVFSTIIFGWEFPDYDTYWNLPNKEDDIARFLNWDPLWQTASVIWRKEALTRIYPFNQNTLSFQDIEIHIKAIIEGLKYKFLLTESDNFHREHEKERIGHQTQDIEHLFSHEKLLSSIYLLLNENNMFTDKRRQSLAGFYFRICNFWIQQNNFKRAIQLWREVGKMKLINNNNYILSVIYFYYLSINKKELIPIFSRVRFIFYGLLPKAFFQKNNTWKKLKIQA